MVITRSGIVALVVLGGTAGAGGAWLATRSTSEPATPTMAAGTAVPADEAGAAARTPPVATELPRPVTRPKPVSARPASAPPSANPSTAAASLTSEPTANRPPDPVLDPAPVESHEPGPDQPAEPIAASVPDPQFEEVVVASDVVLGLQVESTVSSETARIEDQVLAHVTRDVRVGDTVAIPSGARAYGEVTLVERGGRLRDRARLGVRFTSLLLADGSRIPISTDVVFRDGDSPSRESSAKIGGGAIGGAIIGGILGGGKGAIIGSTAGAGAGTAAVMAGGRNAAVLTAGTPITVRLTRPVAITLER